MIDAALSLSGLSGLFVCNVAQPPPAASVAVLPPTRAAEVHAAAEPPPSIAHCELPSCPKCGGEMWDHREGRARDQAARLPRPRPAFTCKAGRWDADARRLTGCDGVIWSNTEWQKIRAEDVTQDVDG